MGRSVELFLEAGVIVLTAFISPFRRGRERVRLLVPPGDFLEIFCRCTLETCEQRDVNGLYKRARAGEIADFTGISSPYEEPEDPELILDTGILTVEECVLLTINLLRERGIVP
jgi:adenylylsulfate kinase